MALFPLSPRASCDGRIHENAGQLLKAAKLHSVFRSPTDLSWVPEEAPDNTLFLRVDELLYAFISLGEYWRRFSVCATSDELDLIRQCDRAVKFLLFSFVSKIMSC
jgi:hypothetical protein